MAAERPLRSGRQSAGQAKEGDRFPAGYLAIAFVVSVGRPCNLDRLPRGNCARAATEVR
jgi:hypothetical protein